MLFFCMIFENLLVQKANGSDLTLNLCLFGSVLQHVYYLAFSKTVPRIIVNVAVPNMNNVNNRRFQKFEQCRRF
jgi:hypothetical protein